MSIVELVDDEADGEWEDLNTALREGRAVASDLSAAVQQLNALLDKIEGIADGD